MDLREGREGKRIIRLEIEKKNREYKDEPSNSGDSDQKEWREQQQNIQKIFPSFFCFRVLAGR